MKKESRSTDGGEYEGNALPRGLRLERKGRGLHGKSAQGTRDAANAFEPELDDDAMESKPLVAESTAEMADNPLLEEREAKQACRGVIARGNYEYSVVDATWKEQQAYTNCDAAETVEEQNV